MRTPERDSQLAGRTIGRYVLCSEIAAGGMATVHLGRLIGPGGFSRTVAIKRLHPQFAKDPEFVAMFLDEARLAGRIRHPNVASVLDVVALEGELFLVMEFVLGESLARLLRNTVALGQNVPLPVAIAMVSGALRGLHAAHEATSETGETLNLVHRDVSPHNVLVGVDGVARVVDFGIAKAANRAQTTRDGQLKGKLSYMSPEQVTRGRIDRRTDVYAASVVLWETLAGARLFPGDEAAAILNDIVTGAQDPPSALRSDIPPQLDFVVMRGLALDPEDRYPTARDMALALENTIAPATPGKIGEWVEATAEEAVQRRAQNLAEVESLTARQSVPDVEGPASGIRPQLVDWNGSNSGSFRQAAEADATVVDRDRGRMPSVPSIATGTGTGTGVEALPTRRRSLSMVLGMGIAAGGLGMGLWLGGGSLQRPSEREPLLVTPAEPTGAAETSSGPNAGLEMTAAGAADAPSAAATPALDPGAADEDAGRQKSAATPAGSRVGSKRYKGSTRRPPAPTDGDSRRAPATGVDFDDLTRK